MKYICIKKEMSESCPLAKVSVQALTVYMSLLSQASNRKHNNVVALWVHRPRNFFNPYLAMKSWNKIFGEKLNELEQAGFVEFAGKSWFKVNQVEGVHLTNSEREANAEDVWAFKTEEFLSKLG